MPTAAPRHCAAGHPAFTGKRCPLCAKAHDRQRGTAAQRGYDADWQAFRADYVRRYPTCQVPGCGQPTVDVHHIVALRHGGLRFDPNNLQPMCHAHHAQITATDRVRRNARRA